MKILVPFSSAELGGSQRSFLRMACLLKNSRFQFHVWIFDQGPFASELQKLNIPVEILPPFWIRIPVFYFRLRSELLKNKPDLIYLHSGRLIALLARIMGIPCIERINLSRKSETRGWCRYQYFDRFFTNLNQGVVAVSEAIKNELLERGIASDKIHVIKNSIPIPTFSGQTEKKQFKARWGIPPESLLIINVGRLVPLKVQSDFIQIAETCLKKNSRLHFLIAGEGPLRDSLQKQIRDCGLARHIQILSFQHEISPLYQAADILLHTSEREALSNVILEAMAHGLPVVATDVGGTKEILSSPELGFLYPAHDNEKAGKIILELASHDSLRIQTGSAAREHMTKNWAPEKEKESFTCLFSAFFHSG